MLWYFAVGMLAAFGAFCAMITVWSWLIPEKKGCAVVCVGRPDAEVLARAKWLRQAGILDIPVIVVTDEAVADHPGAELCSREELFLRLERERNQIDGTGNGDHPGRDQRRGVSEL